MSDRMADLKIPSALLPRATAVAETTDRFCAEHLDLEYAELCRRLIGRLARKRPSPLAGGEVRTWAGGVLHAIGSLNFLFDRTQHPHLTASELCRLAGVSQATAARRSSEIRHLLRLTHFDPELSRREIAERSPLRNLVDVGGLIVPLDLLDSISGDALVESLDTADGRAVELLREALPELSGQPEPAALRHAAIDLRRRLLSRDPVLRQAARANGWSRRLPPDDRQLWIETAGALIAIKNDTGLPAEEESLLMTLDHADFIGAVLGAVRAGVGSPAGPRHLASHIDSCPEVEGEVDEDDRRLIEAAFDLLVPVWQVVGALDAEQRLTELGRWGLPRALAWAWGADFHLPDRLMPQPRTRSSLRRPPPQPCVRCGTGDARQVIGEEGPLCDGCADEVIASRTGWPQLEDPPPPDLFRGPAGIEHRMVYRVLRTPGGIEVLAEEDGWAVDDGYRLARLGPHDADVRAMWEQLRRMVRSAIGCQYLERSPHRDGWVMRDKEVEGRLVWRDDRPGYDAVVDGRRLTWEEFGDALEPFEGWTFRLSIREIEAAK